MPFHKSISPRVAASKAVALARSASSAHWENLRKKNALDLFKKQLYEFLRTLLS